ncbi:MAG: PilT/PilU family type 4a pilus ATPase [Planctomycetota bacterium]|nr:PilT/PilU family type 4a pilus ATPase [Planctomycetota bacterium]
MAQKPSMRALLYNMRKTEASDLHLKIGMPPIYRISGELRLPAGLGPLTPEDTERLLAEIIPPALRERYDRSGDLDFSTFQDLDEGAHGEPSGVRRQERFRCNVFRAGGGMHAAIRRVKPDIPSFESLHLPDVYRKISDETGEGLVLVVGVTGSGKSTTLACMLERINQTKAVNIITVEDPVEYHFHPLRSVISQRELGIDVPSYKDALKYIVRQDPDVIFIGELRDHDTVMAAIQAAETGHLVFGSLHTADTMQCFSRLVEFFPQHEHAFIRSSLAGSLKAICAQRLLPANRETAGVGAVPATEVLINNASVRESIREAQDTNIPAIIAASRGDGMRSFTDSLAELVETEMVTLSTAMESAPSREQLSSRLKGVQVRSTMMTGKVRG